MPGKKGRRASTARLDVPAVAVLILIATAFGLRLFRLDHQSLWLDETTSAYLTTLSPLQVVLDRARNLHVPTYFLLLAGWTEVAGHGEFSLRFFSAWSGVLFVPLLYWASRRLFSDGRTGLLAAFLGTLSPAHVIYSQEARMYAMLPAAYLLLLTLALIPGGLRTKRAWIGLAVSEVVCLYLHLFSAFAVLAINLLLVVACIRRAERRTWLRWMASQAFVGLCCAPWLWVLWRWGEEMPANLSGGGVQRAGLGLIAFLRLVWDFLNSGLEGASPQEIWGANALGVLMALILPLSLAFERRRRTLLAVAMAFFVPLFAAYSAWVWNPLSHPRYLLFLLAPLLVMLARVLALLSRRPRAWVASAAGMCVVLANAITFLGLGLFDPHFFRMDMRALADAISEQAMPGEAVLMPPDDHSLWYYDPAPARLAGWPCPDSSCTDLALAWNLGKALADRPGVFLVEYRTLQSPDPRGQIRFLLEANGQLIERFSIDGMDVLHYALGPERTCTKPVPTAIRCPPLSLTGVYYQEVIQSGNAAVVALRWRLEQLTGDDYQVSVRLWDGEERLADANTLLLDESGRPTGQWEVGEEALDYYVLPLPLGTPPLTYTLRARVYNSRDGASSKWETGEEWLTLGTVRLAHAMEQAVDPYGSWSGVEWRRPFISSISPGLWLDGYAVRPAALKPGDTLYVSLRWRATEDNLAQDAPSLVLGQGEDVLAQDPGSLFERYPTGQWAAGDLLIETRQLPVPATLAPMQLALVVGGRTIPVGEVAVARDALQWQVPARAQTACARLGDVAGLAGYEWAVRPEKPGVGTLTLYWRAAAGSPAAKSYTVFAHLLALDGRLLAQHDGLPGMGKRPTDAWLPGEVIADRHELALRGPHPGAVHLAVGMYDLATMERLPAYDCIGQRLLDDGIPLVALAIEEVP